MIHLYNTLNHEKEEFRPLDPDNVGMYVCGPTVYDRAHVGNARPVVVFDTLFRLLQQSYGAGKVCYVRNITDVDDKINKAAAENKESIKDLTLRTTDAYHKDMAELGTLPPTIEPRATDHIPEIIAMIEDLIKHEHAYEAEQHVLFSVASYDRYGKLSRREIEDMIAGARVEVAPYKKDPMDFVLWKPSADSEPGWDSPWGFGRPGWHIECSAMSKKHLGTTFDIHGGGQDLIFPHHENEIAQSCCANRTSVFARYFMHNGYLTISGDKMSKSLGNFFTVQDLLENIPGEAIRLALQQTHYRQPLDWREDTIHQAKQTLDKCYQALRDIEPTKAKPDPALIKALSDDLNTPLAIARLHELVGDLNKEENLEKRQKLAGVLRASGLMMGILQKDAEEWFQAGADDSDLTPDKIDELLVERNQARADKNFARADEIRDLLAANNIVIEDGAGGSSWKRA